LTDEKTICGRTEINEITTGASRVPSTAYSASVPDQIDVESVDVISIVAHGALDRFVSGLRRYPFPDQPEASGNAMDVRVDRHGRQTKTEEKDASRCLRTNAWQ
jgi:hypothetical protein